MPTGPHPSPHPREQRGDRPLVPLLLAVRHAPHLQGGALLVRQGGADARPGAPSSTRRCPPGLARCYRCATRCSSGLGRVELGGRREVAFQAGRVRLFRSASGVRLSGLEAFLRLSKGRP
eukprot:9317-Prorocentrum_minimum.AAC.1